jgi:hypothetical protein
LLPQQHFLIPLSLNDRTDQIWSIHCNILEHLLQLTSVLLYLLI